MGNGMAKKEGGEGSEQQKKTNEEKKEKEKEKEKRVGADTVWEFLLVFGLPSLKVGGGLFFSLSLAF
jgi:hypothetical protein